MTDVRRGVVRIVSDEYGRDQCIEVDGVRLENVTNVSVTMFPMRPATVVVTIVPDRVEVEGGAIVAEYYDPIGDRRFTREWVRE